MLSNNTKTKSILGSAAVLVAAVAFLAGPLAAKKPPPAAPNQGQDQGQPLDQRQQPPPPAATPKVDVVFVIDTTGSMTGLIQGAKDKIWAIANHIASGKPRPDLRIGLVAYRDIGDEYVTRDFALSGDLDGVYANLRSFQAAGGGDTPEHVNKGLYDAVNGMQWTPGAMKMIFLVGDAPPHMDYHDGFDYHDIVADARHRGITLFTIRCGGDPNTERVWREIATSGKGVYASIAQDGGVVAVTTVYDAPLATLGHELDATTIVYGDDEARSRVATKHAANAAAAPAAAADRGGYYAKTGASLDKDDLVEQVKNGTVKPAELEPAKLPEPMRTMTPPEKQAYVAGKAKEREEVMKQVKDLSAKRDAYMQKKAKEAPAPDSFDNVVNEAITQEGKAYGLAY